MRVYGDFARVREVARRGERPGGVAAHPLLRLQRAAGNRAVVALLGRYRPVVQRINPEDAAAEMVGSSMRVTSAVTVGRTTVPAGSVVVVVAWDNAATDVPVRLAGGGTVAVPKTRLVPVRTAVAGVAPYSAGVGGQVAAVERGTAAIEAERARPGGARPGELPRLAALQRNRERALNRKLIQERMFNRFDGAIAHWTGHYNARFGYTGARALDPNLVKSMLFQESQLGTAGVHLEDPPSHPVKSRFNVGQVIDSSALALLTTMEEMAPALVTRFALGGLRGDLTAAQRELTGLRAVPAPTAAQSARLAELTRLSGQNWETYIWEYPEGPTARFSGGVTEFFRTGGGAAPLATPLNLDYDFWIRALVRWLFEKRRRVDSWAEAIRAYNGSGAQARHYRDAVTGRAAAAERAERDGSEFVPTGS